MAVRRKKGTIDLSNIQMISSGDDAVDLAASDWDEYRKTMDRKHLAIDGEPTIFVLNLKLSGKDSAKVRNNMTQGKDADGEPAVAYGSWTYDLCQKVLKDVIQPADIPAEERVPWRPLEKGALPSSDCMDFLMESGIADEIFTLYMRLVMGDRMRANVKN